jgi:polar amino acid transport system substrate-binding protein
MNIILKRILLLSISILSFMSITSKAAESIDDIIWTTENNAAPYNYVNKNNEVVGESVEIVKRVLKITGSTKTTKDIIALPWTEAYNNALNNKNYALFAAARITEREKLFKWAGPILGDKIVIFSKKSNNIKLENLNDLMKYKVAAIKNEVAQQLVASAVKDLKFSFAVDTKDNLNKLNAGAIDLIVTDASMINYLVKSSGLNPDDYESIYTVKEVKMWIAFNPLTSDALVQMVQTALDKK